MLLITPGQAIEKGICSTPSTTQPLKFEVYGDHEFSLKEFKFPCIANERLRLRLYILVLRGKELR